MHPMTMPRYQPIEWTREAAIAREAKPKHSTITCRGCKHSVDFKSSPEKKRFLDTSPWKAYDGEQWCFLCLEALSEGRETGSVSREGRGLILDSEA